jgi:hypothetical protein
VDGGLGEELGIMRNLECGERFTNGMGIKSRVNYLQSFGIGYLMRIMITNFAIQPFDYFCSSAI